MNDKLIVAKLDILIKLIATNIIKDDSTQTQSILRLNKLGIKNKNISEILNTTENYVKMIISRNKKKKIKNPKGKTKDAKEKEGN